MAMPLNAEANANPAMVEAGSIGIRAYDEQAPNAAASLPASIENLSDSHNSPSQLLMKSLKSTSNAT